MYKKIILLASIFVFGAASAFAAPVKDTGDPSERVCNPASYTDLGNGIVRDNVTGLEWVQDGNLIASRNPEFDNDVDTFGSMAGDGRVTWQHALDYVGLLNNGTFIDYNDWRLSTIKELATLVDSSIPFPGPTIDTDFFPGTVSSSYWASTVVASTPSLAWDIDFRNNGYVGAGQKFYNQYVRVVRGGSYGSSNDFVINGDGTVTDLGTGLMWQQCNYGQTWNGSECTGSAATQSWFQSVERINGLNDIEHLGFDDWRLPTRNELQSLVDYSYYGPATLLPDTASDYYWSSTSVAGDSERAWIVLFSNGWSATTNKNDADHYVRPVRGGLCRSLGDGCVNDSDCEEGYECVNSSCEIIDDFPVIGDGPYLTAGSWPVLPQSYDSAFALDQNYGVLWTFSDDYAACAGACTHAAEYQIAGDDEWSWTALTVRTDPDGVNYAYVELPVEQLQHRTTYALRFSVTDCKGQTTNSDTYYFRVAFYDNPPVIGDGPFLAAGSWPVLPTSSSRAFALNRNYSVLWTFGDDYASCTGPCTHRARYRKVGDTVWTWLPVNTEQRLAWTELPIDAMDNGTYQFRFDVRDCAGQITYSKYYYFKDTTRCCEFSTRVASTTDDGMERQSNGEIRLCSALNTLTMLDLDLGTDDDTYPNAYSACSRQTMLTAMRFTNVGVPPEIDGVPVTVRNAYIEFTARTNNGNTVFRRAALTLAITAEAADNPVTLGTTAYNISGRPETTASVIWNVPGGSFLEEWDSGQTYTSPDLTPIVQELISRPGWQSGNAMLFKIDWIDGNGGRTAHSFDSSAYMAPRLVIEYEP